MVSPQEQNAADLARELEWFSLVLAERLAHLSSEAANVATAALAPPGLDGSSSWYAQFVRHYELTIPERIVLLLALIPHVRPQSLDALWRRNPVTERGFTEFGGLATQGHGGFLPTGETAAFIIGGNDLAARFDTMRLFEGDHFFSQHDILRLAPAAPSEPRLSGALTISPEYLSWLTRGIERKPDFSTSFPARLIEARLEWKDLVLPASTLDQLEEIHDWVRCGKELLDDWGMSAGLQPGFTSLFYGPPGTGKTFSTCLLGKRCGCDVYKIDLSMVVSKYIGETEKNLASVFDMAEHKRWILFFDEADALFGRRTKVDDAHDRYANQEISFLLQRMEEFNGVVVLASNIKANIDEAFMRRFHSVVYFPMPKPAERRRLWETAFSPKAVLDERIDLPRLAEIHEISGGTIMNVVRYASLKTLSRKERLVRKEDVDEGIRRELAKEGRAV